MKGEFLIADLLATPWALRREVLASHMQVLARWLGRSAPAVSLSDAHDADRGNAFEARRRESNARVGSNGGGGIAVIPVVGTITQRAGMMTEWCGGTSTQQISAALAEALRDDAVGQILMEFDTPGGSVFGVAELGDEIHEAAKTKPVIGVANSLSASAGYWLMSQCSQAYVTPGGEVGSIGVWMAHEDWSKAMADSGVVTTMVSAGKFKVEGNPYEPLGEDAGPSCSRGWTTTTALSCERWPGAAAWACSKCAMAWARAGCWAPRRRSPKAWSTAWHRWPRLSGGCSGR